MATGNEELMHDCCPQHLRMGTERIKYNKDTEEERKRVTVTLKRSNVLAK